MVSFAFFASLLAVLREPYRKRGLIYGHAILVPPLPIHQEIFDRTAAPFLYFQGAPKIFGVFPDLVYPCR